MKPKTSILRLALGIGDNFYLSISLQEMLKHFDRIILATPFYKWFQWDERIQCVDPRLNLHLINGIHEANIIERARQKNLDPLTYAYGPSKEYISAYDELDERIGTVVKESATHGCHPGQGYIDGLYYAKHYVYPDIHEYLSSTNYKAKLSGLDSDQTDLEAIKWFAENGIDPRKAVLFHMRHTAKGVEQFQYHTIKNPVIVRVAEILRKNGFQLYDIQHPHSMGVAPLDDVPRFLSQGYEGMSMVSSLIKASLGVVLQSTCRYLPLAQMHNKPMMVCRQGGFPLRAHNWPALEAPMFIELTPDDFHMCRLSTCDTCSSRQTSDFMIQHRTDSLIKMMIG